MDVERIYNCLSESFEQPTLISLGSLGEGEEGLQGELFDFSEDAPEVCKLVGRICWSFPPPRRQTEELETWSLNNLRGCQEPSVTHISMVPLHM